MHAPLVTASASQRPSNAQPLGLLCRLKPVEADHGVAYVRSRCLPQQGIPAAGGPRRGGARIAFIARSQGDRGTASPIVWSSHTLTWSELTSLFDPAPTMPAVPAHHQGINDPD